MLASSKATQSVEKDAQWARKFPNIYLGGEGYIMQEADAAILLPLIFLEL